MSLHAALATLSAFSASPTITAQNASLQVRTCPIYSIRPACRSAPQPISSRMEICRGQPSAFPATPPASSASFPPSTALTVPLHTTGSSRTARKPVPWATSLTSRLFPVTILPSSQLNSRSICTSRMQTNKEYSLT